MKTVSELIAKYRQVEYWWHALDEPILELCSRYPEHTDPRIVFGKVALINRVYRANVQMGTRNAEWKVAVAFVEARLNPTMDTLRKHTDLAESSLPALLDAHQQLVEITLRATGRVTESFCSKYLSFHFPQLAPLFDTLAEKTAKRLPLTFPPSTRALNARYRDHCARILKLVATLRTAGIAEPNLKKLDYVLYNPDQVEGQA
jgi:hypothetical protein